MDTITTSGLVTSLAYTPQAGDDAFAPSGLGEDATAVFYLDVMANDLGGKAKTLYSLDDGLDSQGCATAADLLTRDLVGSDNFSQHGALIQITADGRVAYSMTDASRAHFQSLGVGEVGHDSFTYAIRLASGALSWATVSVSITGANDAPVIELLAGDSAAATLTETDAGLSIDGTLSVTDVDLSDTVSAGVTAVSLTGAAGALTAQEVLGFLTLSPASGLAADPGDAHNLRWSFDSGMQAFDYLQPGESLTLAYTVEASDGNGGTATQQVSITIHGTADGPSDIVLTGMTPGGNQVPNGSIGQLSAMGAAGAVSYSAVLVEKTLAGVVQNDPTPDISVSESGLVSAAGGSSGIEEGRIYELEVTATDSGGSLTKTFRVITGSTSGDTINLAAVGDDLVFLAGGNDTILAGDGNDTVFGQNGSDFIHGGDGNDVLYGMNGADTFFFDTALNGASNVDAIMDFNAGNNGANADKLYLSTAWFSGIGSGAGVLAAADFQQVSSGGTGDVSALSVGGAVNIVYDASTGGLYFDVDGGSLANAVQFAVVHVVEGTFDHGDILFGA